MTPPGFQPVVLVPSYNHGPTLPGVLEGLAPLGLPVLVINDGSTDDTTERLETYLNTHSEHRVRVLTHDRNLGKAAALRTGFREALKSGHTHAVTIDADGQLDPADIPRFLETGSEHPEALLLGCRPTESVGRPKHCGLGRQSAGFAVRAQTGVWLGDTQCGLRCYPIRIIENLGCHAERFAFESEVITKMLWSGGEVLEVPVTVSYEPPGGRVSHYRPVIDSVRQLVMHVWLFVLALLPLRRRVSGASAASPAAGHRGRVRGFFRWINPARCWRELRDSDLGSLELSLAVAVGALIGTSPFFGLHTAMCLYVAWRTRLHPAAMLIGSQVSIPPLGIGLAWVSIVVGRSMLGLITSGEHWDHWPPLSWEGLPSLTWDIVLSWLVGSVVVGLVVAVVLFVTLQVTLPIFRRRAAVRVAAEQTN